MKNLIGFIYALLLIITPVTMIYVSKTLWGNPEDYVICFLSILGVIVSAIGLKEMIFGNKSFNTPVCKSSGLK